MSQIKQEEVPESLKETTLQDEEVDSEENAAIPDDDQRDEEEIMMTTTTTSGRFCSPSNNKCRILCAVILVIVVVLIFVIVFTTSSTTTNCTLEYRCDGLTVQLETFLDRLDDSPSPYMFQLCLDDKDEDDASFQNNCVWFTDDDLYESTTNDNGRVWSSSQFRDSQTQSWGNCGGSGGSESSRVDFNDIDTLTLKTITPSEDNEWEMVIYETSISADFVPADSKCHSYSVSMTWNVLPATEQYSYKQANLCVEDSDCMSLATGREELCRQGPPDGVFQCTFASGGNEGDSDQNMTDSPAQVPSCPPAAVENEAIYPWSENAIFVDHYGSLVEGVKTILETTNNTDSFGRLPDIDEMEIVNKSECTSDVGSPAQWFKLSPQKAGTEIFVWTCSPQTQFDTVINVFKSTATATTSGGGCPTTTTSLQCLGSNDDHTMTNQSNACVFAPRQSAMTITSSHANETIYIAVSGNDPTEYGDFELFLSASPPPPIEEAPPGNFTPGATCPFDNAVPFNYYDGVTFSGSTFYSQPTLPSMAGCSLNTGSNAYWFKFEPEEIGLFLIETCNVRTDFDTVITVFKEEEGVTALEGTQGCEDQVTCIASNDDHLFEDMGNSLLCTSHQKHSALEVAAETVEDAFYVALSGFSNIDAGTFVIRFTDITPATITVGDCVLDTATPIANIPTVDSAPIEILGSTIGATATLPSGMDACGVYSVGSPTVWYYFETSAARKFLITTCHPNTDFDTVISVYQPLQQYHTQQEDHCNVHCIAVNDDDRDNTPERCASIEGNNRLRSFVEITSQPPQSRFYIAVSGARPDRSGNFVLSITRVPII